MRELRHAVGLRNLAAAASGKKEKAKASLPSFKQYREADGLFYFKFVDAQGGCCCRAPASLRPGKRASASPR